MYLATTALEEYWDKSQKILFLGEWCKLYGRKKEWEKLDYETLPYHWDDRKKLQRDHFYVVNLYEKVLAELSPIMNEIHSRDYPLRYWRIILGPWLSSFIEILFDRYESIRQVRELSCVEETYIGKFHPEYWTIPDYKTFYNFALTDEFNFYIYSKCIETDGGLPYSVVAPQNSLSKVPIVGGTQFEQKKRHSLIYIAKKLISSWDRLLPSFFTRTTFVSTLFPIRHQIMLQLSLGQLPYFGRPSENYMQDTTFDPALRRRVALEIGSTGFELFLSRMIGEQFPRYYLENYRALEQIALDSLPQRPQLIMTAVASHFDELFKFWCAHWVHRGSKFAHTQHGGAYGMWLWLWQEDHECEISDVYYSFGWTDEQKPRVVPMPSIKLAGVKHLKPKKNGYILLVHGAIPRYAYLMVNGIISASGYMRYLEEQFRFIEGLNESSRDLLVVRPYMHDYGMSQRKRFEDRIPGVKLQTEKSSMYQQMMESRLFIGTYNATNILEAFAADFPSVLFWNPNECEVRPSAAPYFDSLREVGILHDTPESAATLVNAIWDDPLVWWRQADVQKAKDEFCWLFARTSKDCIQKWAKCLRGISKAGKCEN